MARPLPRAGAAGASTSRTFTQPIGQHSAARSPGERKIGADHAVPQPRALRCARPDARPDHHREHRSDPEHYERVAEACGRPCGRATIARGTRQTVSVVGCRPRRAGRDRRRSRGGPRDPGAEAHMVAAPDRLLSSGSRWIGHPRRGERDAVAEQHRQHVDQDLVDEPALQALPGDVRTEDLQVLAVCGEERRGRPPRRCHRSDR